MKLQKVTPFLWFEKDAQRAVEFYVSVFPGSRVVQASPMVTTFELAGVQFMALNGGPTFKLTPAYSMFVTCEDQREVDTLWAALLADGGAPSQCGWLTDRFGVSWQVVPAAFMRLASDADPKKAQAVMQAMLKMVKLDVAALEKAHREA